jgi:putative ABC transport system permease protein
VALVLFAEVLTRRKDLGRQRALGARRSTVIMLLASRTAAAAGIGSILGLVVGLAYLASIDELPTLRFILGLAFLSILAPTLASVVPARWAAQRDPVLELRTP